jgi:branched-chain amino acid aminotransferase
MTQIRLDSPNPRDGQPASMTAETSVPSVFGEPFPRVYVDGSFRSSRDARLSVLANAVSYGTGTFEGIRAYWNHEREQLYMLEPYAHFERLARSARILGLPLKHEVEELVEAARELLNQNEVRGDAYLRPLLLLSQERLHVRMHDIATSLIIAATPVSSGYLPSNGLRCMVSTWRRTPDVSIPMRAKVIGSYVGPALAKTEALQAGFDEAILLTVDGYVAEATTSNVFIHDSDGWVTPLATDDILAGITQRQVIEILHEEFGEQVTWRRVQRSELYTANEIFLCGTASVVAPVVSVDGRRVGDGTPGMTSGAVRSRLESIARRETDDHPGWTTPVYGAFGESR